MSKIENVTVNEDQGLYVVHVAGGYTCLGFDVCLDRCRKYAGWLRSKGVRASAPLARKRGSIEAYARYRELADKILEIHHATGARCEAELIPELVGMEGRRVEVVDCYGDKRRFIVGKSTGWIPIHLEIHNRRSSGGVGVCGTPFRSVRAVG